MSDIRRQLTLFVSDPTSAIEEVRSNFNPEQFRLIAAHVTLCREDELNAIEAVYDNLRRIKLEGPLKITFGRAQRFDEGRGVLIPQQGDNQEFHALRNEILVGVVGSVRLHRPHITLMHPRNSLCTDDIFAEISSHPLPCELAFDEISLIEQQNGGVWRVTDRFRIFG